MRELTYYVAVSLDGFIAGPDGQLDAFPVEGDHMGAITALYPETLPTDAAAALGVDQIPRPPAPIDPARDSGEGATSPTDATEAIEAIDGPSVAGASAGDVTAGSGETVAPSGRVPFDTVLMGWNTYEVGLRLGAVSPYRHLRQIVFTRSHLDDELGGDHRSAEGEGPAEQAAPTLTADDPVAVVRALKAEEGGGIWLCGGGALAASLVGEIDRLVLKRNPVLLGTGIPLFGPSPAGYDPRLFGELSTTAFASGVVMSEYCRR
jgi:dihydrofolate reductase